MSAAVEYPQSAPAQTPPGLRKSELWRCQYCRSNLHPSCPGAVRLPKGLWLCYCCKKPPRCLDCGATEDVDPNTWGCVDTPECADRVRLRQQLSPLYNMLQQAKVSAANSRRRRRLDESRIRAQVPVDEDEVLDLAARRTSTLRRSATGNCECCGAPTKGGRFLPGHDAKLKSKLRKLAEFGSPEQQQQGRAELQSRGWA